MGGKGEPGPQAPLDPLLTLQPHYREQVGLSSEVIFEHTPKMMSDLAFRTETDRFTCTHKHKKPKQNQQ